MTADAPSPGPADPTHPPLTLTGERTLPGIADERYWFARHVVAYEYAADLVARSAAAGSAAAVLDAGCGEGYGVAMIAAAGAHRTIGVDLDSRVIAHARAAYAHDDLGIEFAAAELMSLPLGAGEVTLTVSFQVIEHLHDIPGYLASLRRVTAPHGRVLIATPNRLTFTPGSDAPVNPFHTREFAADELTAELAGAGYEVDEMLGIHHGDRLRAFESARGVPLPSLLATSPPAVWDTGLRNLVHGTQPDDFELHGGDLDACLDLLAVCRVPAAPPSQHAPDRLGVPLPAASVQTRAAGSHPGGGDGRDAPQGREPRHVGEAP